MEFVLRRHIPSVHPLIPPRHLRCPVVSPVAAGSGSLLLLLTDELCFEAVPRGVAERQGRNEYSLLRQSSLEFAVVLLREESLVVDSLILFLYLAEAAVVA